MRIGFDIDGVLFPWSDCANAALMAEFGIEDPGPHVSWEHLSSKVTPEQWAWLWGNEGSRAVFGQLDRVYPRAIEAVNALLRNPKNKVHFVTHRDPRRTSVLTASFLELHFGGHPWAGLHVLQNGTPKHELAEWDVFVDDKPDTVLAFLAWTGTEVFAPVRPWNSSLATLQAEDYFGFHHYDDPAEIVEWVEGVR